jgi:hypothetical protein
MQPDFPHTEASMKPSLSVAAVVLSLLVLPAAGRAQEHAAPAPTLDAIIIILVA